MIDWGKKKIGYQYFHFFLYIKPNMDSQNFDIDLTEKFTLNLVRKKIRALLDFRDNYNVLHNNKSYTIDNGRRVTI